MPILLNAVSRYAQLVPHEEVSNKDFTFSIVVGYGQTYSKVIPDFVKLGFVNWNINDSIKAIKQRREIYPLPKGIFYYNDNKQREDLEQKIPFFIFRQLNKKAKPWIAFFPELISTSF